LGKITHFLKKAYHKGASLDEYNEKFKELAESKKTYTNLLSIGIKNSIVTTAGIALLGSLGPVGLFGTIVLGAAGVYTAVAGSIGIVNSVFGIGCLAALGAKKKEASDKKIADVTATLAESRALSRTVQKDFQSVANGNNGAGAKVAADKAAPKTTNRPTP
jgi:hypothetical protein